MAQESIHDARIQRLAFVNGWSDELVVQAQEHLQGTPDELLAALQRAAEDLNLSALRGGDGMLALRAAETLGFASAHDLHHFQRENPLLSAALKAEPALKGGSGVVVGVSATEVVFATEQGPMFFERARLKADLCVGDSIRIGEFGEAEVTAGAPAPVYESGKKYHGPIPEIKYLPVTAIHRQEMDFRPEVLVVSDEVAANMDFSEPVEVTAYRYGPASHDTLPEVTLRDGHHRTAAAIQTGRAHLPVKVSAINAMGDKLNALIAMSRGIESKLKEASMTKESCAKEFTHCVYCVEERVADLCVVAARVGSYDRSLGAVEAVLDEEALTALKALNPREYVVYAKGVDGKDCSDLCYYSRARNEIIADVDVLGLTVHSRRTQSDVLREYPDAVLIRSSEAMREFWEAKEREIDRSVREVSAERYDEMLNILPPVAWTRSAQGVESFKISEALFGDFRAIFARIGDRYFSFNEHGSITHDLIIARVRAAIENRTVVPEISSTESIEPG